MTAPSTQELALEIVSLDELRPHPRNYQKHPDDELEHLAQSIRDFGIYRNVVCARDGTLLAGHGVVEAARRMDATTIPVCRLDLDPSEPRALLIANAFTAISIGHFPTYACDGQHYTGRDMNRRFADELRRHGYQKITTHLWNNRPTYWTRSRPSDGAGRLES